MSQGKAEHFPGTPPPHTPILFNGLLVALSLINIGITCIWYSLWNSWTSFRSAENWPIRQGSRWIEEHTAEDRREPSHCYRGCRRVQGEGDVAEDPGRPTAGRAERPETGQWQGDGTPQGTYEHPSAEYSGNSGLGAPVGPAGLNCEVVLFLGPYFWFY